MQTSLALFSGADASGMSGLWVTDGTAAGTWEISVAGTSPTGFIPAPLTAFGNEVLFSGWDANNHLSLWVTDGTSPGTSKLAVDYGGLVVFGNKALFGGGFFGDLWVTDGSPGGTSQVVVPGAAPDGLDISGLTVFGTEVLFSGQDTSGHYALWVTDGTSAGTSELAVSSANWSNSGPSNFTVLGNKVLFNAVDVSGTVGLWVTDGTSAGTSELSVAGVGGGSFGFTRSPFVVLGSEALFAGVDASNNVGLWVTDGTGPGTSEISILGAFSESLSGGVFALVSPHFVRFGSEVLFEGSNNSGHFGGLWVTDGTSAGTSELTVAGASPSGVLATSTPNFFVLGSEVLFDGLDASDVVHSLWVTDGTSAGTSELSVAGANSVFGLFATAPPSFGAFGSEALFSGNDSAHGLNELWATDGTATGTTEIPVAGAGTRDGLTPGGFTAFTQDLLQPALSNVPASDTYLERGAPVTLAPSLHPSDDNSTAFVSATVSITGGTFTNDGDVLAATTTATSISASYNSATETLTLTGTDTLANYRLVLDSVTFASPSHNPTNYGSDPTRVITWVVNDGTTSNNLGAAQTTTLSVTPVNDPPTLSNVAASGQFTEAAGAVTLSSAVSITDLDDLDLSSATVKVTGGTFVGGGDMLSATTSGTSITASYNDSTETLTLTGLDTLSNYQTTLDSVTFNDTSLNPTNYGSSPTRSITWILTDPSGTLNGGVNVSTPVTTTISITAIDNPPTLSKVATTATVRGPSQIVTLSPALAVSDPDNLTLAGATVSVSGGAFPGDGDVLAATTASTSITASYNSVTETLALSGTDTLAHYAQVLDSVTFASTGATPANSGAHPTRTVSWVLNDGSASNNLSAAAATTVSIAPVVSYNFNGDGFADLLFQNTNATPQIWLMNGASIVSNTTLPQPPATWKIVGSGDFNGDGNADMLWLNTVTNQPAIWEMNGTAIISAVGLPAPPPSWRVAGIGDFFGNGDADILWQNADGTPAIWQMNGTSLVSAVALPAPPPSWKIAATGDFNGDGKGDILWQNADGTPAIWEMNGDSIVSAVALTPQPPSMEIIGTGDFSGTGDADILWLNTATNAPVIWMMDGTSVVGTATLPAPPPSWRLVGTSDLYGTGKADILWQNSNGAVSVWQMNGTSIVTAVDAGNPGASWILNNNDPPLPMAVQPSTNAVLGPIMTGGVAPSFIAGGTTVANTAHLGGG